MEKILNIYLIITNIVAFISLVSFVALISYKISQKHPFKIMSWIFLIITLIGMYLFIPSRFFIAGIINQNINYIENAIRISINPIEKELYRHKLLDIYILNEDYQKAQIIFNQINKKIKNKYLDFQFSKGVNDARKIDLFMFKIRNAYNLKMEEYNKKIEKLRINNQ